MLNENISRIIRWYKGRTTFESRKIHADFAWQSRFHDHIIRDEISFENISAYIKKNPLNWNPRTDAIHRVSSDDFHGDAIYRVSSDDFHQDAINSALTDRTK
jgi:hypothetical protein